MIAIDNTMAIRLSIPTYEWSSGIDKEYHRTYSRSYDVYTDSLSDGPGYVRANFGITLYSYYNANSVDVDTGARVSDIGVECQGPITALPTNYTNALYSSPGATGSIQGLKYKVTVNWTYWNPFETSSSGSPVDYAPHLKVEGTTHEELVKKDVDGTPILNAAGEAFDPPVLRDGARSIFRVSRNENNTNVATMMGYANQVNSDTFFGLPPRTVKFHPPTLDKDWDQFLGQTYMKCEYTFEYNVDGWDKKILNCGMNAIGTDPSGNPTLVPITTKGGASQGPFLLDRTGAFLPPPYNSSSELVVDPSGDTTIGPGDSDGESNEGPSATSGSSVVYLLFQVYESFNMTTPFNFPTNLFSVGY